MLVELKARSGNQCELCGSNLSLSIYKVPDLKSIDAESQLLACNTCIEQIDDSEKIDPNHWRCLNESMWSEYNAVKIMAWRMLHRVNADWSVDLLDMMYLEDDLLENAKASGDGEAEVAALIHKDVNGVELKQGDSVVLIKDLKVKGSSMVAKQGTAVRNIRLDHENEKYIEGKVDSQNIVLITDYVKRI